MIELLMTPENNTLLCIAKVLNWLCGVCAPRADCNMEGWIVVRGKDGGIRTLVVCSDPYQKNILTILQQPPPGLEGCYIPCIMSEEPEPVTMKDDDATEEKVEPCAEAAAKTAGS